MSTQRLPRSSRTPALILPPAKHETIATSKNAAANAASAGRAKNAANPRQPRIAKPK
jgi:hypothetical protein